MCKIIDGADKTDKSIKKIKNRAKKIDLRHLKSYLENNKNLNLKELSWVFKVKTRTMSNYLKQIGFYYKKVLCSIQEDK